MYTGAYSVFMNNVAVTGAITLVQIKPVTVSIVLLRAWFNQSNITTSGQQRIQILLKTAAATVTSATPQPLYGSDQAAKSVGSTSGTGTNASGEGTDGNVIYPDAFNILTGWLWVPVPEERITIPAGVIVALKLPTAPGASTTVTAGFTFAEIG